MGASDKIVQYGHKKQTNSKADRQYIKTIIHNLSLQRWTDQEISDYLKKEKKIEISRSRVTTIKNNIEQEAEKRIKRIKVQVRSNVQREIRFLNILSKEIK